MGESQPTLRKRIVKTPGVSAVRADEAVLDIPTIATVIVTSEDPAHPIDNVFTEHRDTGGVDYWMAADVGEQSIILNFDKPQTIRQIMIDIEEREVQRTQELTIAVSSNGGRTYQELIRQQYNFSPPGTVRERENWTVSAERVTHLCLQITPDKGGKQCRATLTTLVLR
jgi:hypothetical protein